MVGVGVLADVHGGELEAEGGEGADGAGQAPVGEEAAAVLAQEAWMIRRSVRSSPVPR